MSGKMVKCFFQSYNKCFISDSIFRFGQIVFTLARTFAVHREKGVVSGFLRSVLITYLITSSLEKEIIVLEKSPEKVFNFGLKNLHEPRVTYGEEARPLEVQHFSKSSSTLPFFVQMMTSAEEVADRRVDFLLALD